jgi:HlyD family secretion protein
MNLSLTTLAPIMIVGLGGLMLVWWLTGRATGWVRTLLRVLLIPAFIALIALVVLPLALPSAAGFAAATGTAEAAPIVPAEQMTVQNGTLTVALNSTGSLEAADEETLTFNLSAPVTEVLVTVGERVEAGAVLARADTTAIESQIRSAQLSLQSAQNSLTALKAPATEIEIELAKLQVESAQASLSSASLTGATDQDIEIARIKVEQAKNSLYQAQLSRDAAVAQGRYNADMVINAYSNQVKQDAQLEQSDNSITSAQTSYEATLNDGPDASSLASGNASLISAQASLDSLLAGPTESELRQAEITVETAQMTLDAAQQDLADATLTAPFAGVVAAVDFVPGTLAASGSITLIDTSAYTITLSVDEKDITQLAVGQPVTLSVQALDDVSIPGTVTRVDLVPVSSTSGQLVTYNVEVTLNTADEQLRPGLSTIATVTLKQLNNVIVVPNRFITVDANTQQATVKVQTAAETYEDVPVTLGTRTDNESQIVSGLTLGQTLVILPAASETDAASGFSMFGGGGMPGGGMGGGMPAGGPPSGGMPSGGMPAGGPPGGG